MQTFQISPYPWPSEGQNRLYAFCNFAAGGVTAAIHCESWENWTQMPPYSPVASSKQPVQLTEYFCPGMLYLFFLWMVK